MMDGELMTLTFDRSENKQCRISTRRFDPMFVALLYLIQRTGCEVCISQCSTVQEIIEILLVCDRSEILIFPLNP